MLQKLGAFDFEKNYRKLLKAAMRETTRISIIMTINCFRPFPIRR